MERQVFNRQKVKDFGEVFTAEREVKAMCDLIPAEIWENIDSTFLEPACGNGNFLAEILRRKFTYCKTAKDGLRAIKSVYGIEIQPCNAEKSRIRLFNMFLDKFPEATERERKRAKESLKKNIACGDGLKIMKEYEDEIY